MPSSSPGPTCCAGSSAASSSQLAELGLLRELNDALVEQRVEQTGHGEDAADDGADLDKEVGEALSGLLVPHRDRREVVPQIERRHLLVHDLVRVGRELVDVQGLPVQGDVRRGHDLRVVLEDGGVDVAARLLLRHDLRHAVQGGHDACALEVLLDEGDVGVLAERHVVDGVGDVHVPRLLVQGAKEVGVAVSREMHVARHLVDLHKARDAAALAAVDHLPDAVDVLVVVVEAEVPREARGGAVVAGLDLLAGDDVALGGQPLLEEVAVRVHLVAAHHVLRVEGEQLAGHRRHGDVQVDLQLLLSLALVDEHLALPSPLEEDVQLRKEEVAAQKEREERHQGARDRGLREVPRDLAVQVEPPHGLHRGRRSHSSSRAQAAPYLRAPLPSARDIHRGRGRAGPRTQTRLEPT
mmetsp:Transcript_29017/g.76720  ORF Transcript_29017/g.76720 Transcript_29017/m.76720 type:complete len:411 (+) Transcript_29017:87-1319(+)